MDSVRRKAGVFVGRQQEMAELKAALEDALAGRGRVVALAGEPGIGKTRTAQELANHAETLSFQVLWGRCYEEEGAPAYWPWIQLIRSYLRRTAQDQLEAEMGPGAADISEIVPEVREKLPDLAQPPLLETEQARFRLFDSITTFLKAAAQTQPLLVVLDDLHWADTPSLLLLQFMAQGIADSHLLVLGCYRDIELSRQHPLTETLARLSRESIFQRETLGGLSHEETGGFIEAAGGVEPALDLVDAVHRRTEGNPLFMTEVVRVLADRGQLATGSIDGPQLFELPLGIQEAIGQRLNRLSEPCLRVLTTASVIGREFGFRPLRTLISEDDEEQLLDALEEASGQHLIAELPEGVGYQFSHALVQETLVSQLSTARRVQIHARIGEVLEQLYGDDVAAHAAELAYHFNEAEALNDTKAKAVSYSLMAGEQALATYAQEEAIQHFQRGLAAKARQTVDAETAALLYGLGRAQAAALQRHELDEAYRSLSDAFEYYASVGDLDHIVAIGEHPGIAFSETRTGMSPLNVRALALIPDSSNEMGRLLSCYGYYQGLDQGDYQAAQQSFDQALAIAERDGDAALEMRTLAYAAQVDVWNHRFQTGLERSLRAIELAMLAGNARAEVGGRYSAAMASLMVGDIAELRRQGAAILAPAERLRDRYWLATAFLMASTVPVVEGDWETARQLNNQGLKALPMDYRLLSHRVTIELLVGAQSEGAKYLERMIEHVRQSPADSVALNVMLAIALPVADHMLGALNNADLAEASIAAVLASPSPVPMFSAWAKTGAALLAVLRGDADLARQESSAMESMPGLWIVMISSDRVLGLLAQTMGELDRAAAHFEEALAFCRKAGYLTPYAWVAYEYACALIRRNGPGDLAQASSLLDEALALATELGMMPLLERVTLLTQRTSGQPARRLAFPDGLTVREVEVLRLISAGKTDREIAEGLIISVRTVTTHVGNILNKTGSANRTEAAAYAARHGLSDQAAG